VPFREGWPSTAQMGVARCTAMDFLWLVKSVRRYASHTVRVTDQLRFQTGKMVRTKRAPQVNDGPDKCDSRIHVLFFFGPEEMYGTNNKRGEMRSRPGRPSRWHLTTKAR
jgi:hypothetical protein